MFADRASGAPGAAGDGVRRPGRPHDGHVPAAVSIRGLLRRGVGYCPRAGRRRAGSYPEGHPSGHPLLLALSAPPGYAPY